MNPAEDFSAYLRRLREDPQAAARSAAASGERVVAYVGNDVPAALILAAGALPVRLRANTSAATASADRFVESSFAPELRAIAQQWMQGALGHLHAVIFARSDDSGQRLYYYLCEMQRRGLCAGPVPLLYDVATLARGASFEHTLESTRLLASQLGTSLAALPAAFERVVQREDLLRGIRCWRTLRRVLRPRLAVARQLRLVVRVRFRMRLADRVRRGGASVAGVGTVAAHFVARVIGRRFTTG